MPDPTVITDDFTGADDDPWDPAIWDPIRMGVGDIGETTIQSNAGRMGTGPSEQGRIIAFVDTELADIDLVVKFTPVSATPLFPWIGYRFSGNIAGPGHPTNGYVVAWEPAEDEISMLRFDGSGTTAGATLAFNHEPAIGFDPLWVHLYCRADRHRLKWWNDGDTEPEFWQFDATDATYTAAGRMFLTLWNDADTVTVEGDWDDLTITEILPPDPGIRVGSSIEYLEALYVGDHQVIEAVYQGEVEIPVP